MKKTPLERNTPITANVQVATKKREKDASIGRMTTVRELLVDNEADKERYKSE